MSLLLGTALGTAFYVFGEVGVSTQANCSYLASPWTDVAASVAGIALIIDSRKTGSSVEACVDGAVVAIHSLQWLFHKGMPALRMS